MKIAIIGHGKMGRLVEKIAIERGHEISCIIDAGDDALFDSEKFKKSDVAIEFTVPGAAIEGILRSFSAGVPVVVGTTGWTEKMPEIKSMCLEGKGTLLFSSNFSIGMNIFMSLNKYLATVMNDFENYDVSLEEVHHIHKLDHPSGTAITLAEDLIGAYSGVSAWKEYEKGEETENEILPVYHKREGEVPGIHTVQWESGCDTITITHSAKNREGFALGAVRAAEWLAGKKGFYTLKDMLRETTGLGF